MFMKALVDVSVLILFFNRPEQLAKVFGQVRKARPSRLFLYQDGPRDGKDIPGIMACRKVVSDIDWECDVHTMFQEKNYGCDPSEFISQRWAFSLTDKCIVLEDDDVPSVTFFRFCKEMLDKYEDDTRITHISGFNTDETTNDIEDSYFFSRAFSIWGWASWARVVNAWDGDYGFVKDPDQFGQLRQKTREHHLRSDMPAMCAAHARRGKEYYETIFWAYMTLNDGMCIIPRVNMINNIGMEGGTHYSAQLNLLPRRLRRQFTMKRHEIDFPLHHPAEVREYPGYQRRYHLLNAWDNPWRKVQYSFEELWLNLMAGNIGNIISAARKRILKTMR
ncbi:MAG: hemolysin activation protein [Bacteroidaceae bacterium]|nr:hemolysin activation protein [Bacteroidaceae bacterium]MBR1468327.1 hemolysin activation protein [Bacteroidaceae bacterium]